jgi:hypothetical protein
MSSTRPKANNAAASISLTFAVSKSWRRDEKGQTMEETKESGEVTAMALLRRLSDGVYQAIPADFRARYEKEIHDALLPLAAQMAQAIREGEPGRLLYCIGATAKCLELMCAEVVTAGQEVTWN